MHMVRRCARPNNDGAIVRMETTLFGIFMLLAVCVLLLGSIRGQMVDINSHLGVIQAQLGMPLTVETEHGRPLATNVLNPVKLADNPLPVVNMQGDEPTVMDVARDALAPKKQKGTK